MRLALEIFLLTARKVRYGLRQITLTTRCCAAVREESERRGSEEEGESFEFFAIQHLVDYLPDGKRIKLEV